jgi:hypothetical protein
MFMILSGVVAGILRWMEGCVILNEWGEEVLKGLGLMKI